MQSLNVPVQARLCAPWPPGTNAERDGKRLVSTCSSAGDIACALDALDEYEERRNEALVDLLSVFQLRGSSIWKPPNVLCGKLSIYGHRRSFG